MARVFYSIYLLLFFTCSILFAKTIKGQPFAHTFSIVAVDKDRGEMGVAVQSHWFSVGSIVSWAEPGVGAIATQSLVNASFGPRGLELLKQGKSPQEALKLLLSADAGRAFRQVAIIDAKGNNAAHTGSDCIAEASHHQGKNFTVQANMMLNDKVIPAMTKTFENSSAPLAERLVAALRAAQEAGGDIRGQQSASLLIVKTTSSGKLWQDRLIDLRVEDHPEATAELERILKVHRAYEHMNKGDLAIEQGDEQRALAEYGLAQKMFPRNIEMKYWTAVSLANIGQLDKGLPLFRKVFLEDENWVLLTRRIFKNKMLAVDKKSLDIILNIHK